MSDTIKIDGLEDAIKDELKLYSNTITDSIKKQAKKSMSQLVKQTKATAPVGNRPNHYRDSIRGSKIEDTPYGVNYAWNVKGSDYRLSHLLEDGHAFRDGGRYEGTQFIRKAAEPILDDYEKKVEEIISNG